MLTEKEVSSKIFSYHEPVRRVIAKMYDLKYILYFIPIRRDTNNITVTTNL